MKGRYDEVQIESRAAIRPTLLTCRSAQKWAWNPFLKPLQPDLTALKDAMGHGVPSHPDLEGSCARANKFLFTLNCDKNRTMCDLNVQM